MRSALLMVALHLAGSGLACAESTAPVASPTAMPALCTARAAGPAAPGWPGCIDILLRLRASADAEARRLADRALRTITDPGARVAVEQAIVRADPMGRLALMASLDRLATESSLPTLERMLLDDPDALLRGRAYALIEKVSGTAPVLLVLEALESKSAERRERAAYAVAEVQLESATPRIIEMARSDPSPAVRIAAVEAFRQVGGDGAEDAVAEALLKDRDEGVRVVATRVLGAIGWRSSEALIRALRDPSEIVRRVAAASLGQLGVRDAIPELSRLANTDADETVRAVARDSLEILRGRADSR